MYATGHKVLSSKGCHPGPKVTDGEQYLAVDDGLAVCNLTRVFLERCCDCVVCGEASDGLEAVDKARKLSPDLIVMDLCMPRMNGLAAARILSSKAPDIPIVLFTTHENVLPHSEANLVGIGAVVSKNKLEVFLAEVKVILNPS